MQIKQLRLHMKITRLLWVFLFQTLSGIGQDTRILTYEEAVNIALNESYTIKSHLENKKAMQSYFMYHKAQFKPRLDLNPFCEFAKWVN